jgi:hypothetical protein
MATSKQAQAALPYVQRLVEDEYVQEQLRTAAVRLRDVYRRAARQRGKAAEDKKLYGNLRQAATSIRNATTALQRRKPEPKRRGRKVLAIALVGAGAAALMSGRGREKLKGALSGASARDGTGPTSSFALSEETPRAAAATSSPD